MNSNEHVIMTSALQASDHSIDALTAYVDAMEELTELRRQLRGCEHCFNRFQSPASQRIMENKQEEVQDKFNEVEHLRQIWSERRQVTLAEIESARRKIS